MNDIDIEVGGIIKNKRKSLRMTQEELGKKIGVVKMTICQYESGKRQMDLLTFFKICHALNIDPEYVRGYLDQYLEKYYR